MDQEKRAHRISRGYDGYDPEETDGGITSHLTNATPALDLRRSNQKRVYGVQIEANIGRLCISVSA